MIKENLLYEENFPIAINFLEIEKIYSSWHKELKIIYLLEGQVSLDCKKEKYFLEENDFFIVNSYDLVDIQTISLNKTIVLEILIDNIFLNKLYEKISYIKFYSYSKDLNIESFKYEKVRFLISKILNKIVNRKVDSKILIYKQLINLTLYLVNNFKIEGEIIEKDMSNKYRLMKILNFIENNYEKEELNVQNISDFMKLSPQYLQKIFRENLSIGIIEYLNSYRIKKSTEDLKYTNKSVLEISIDNGFTNNKTYHRLFKKYYGITPLNFRKESFNYSENINVESQSLLRFSEYYLKETSAFLENEIESIIINCDLNKPLNKKFHFNWKKIISIGKASEGLKGDIQYQLKEIKRDINPKYVRFTGIFNDEMNVYNEDKEGNSYYNFAYVDKLIDFLFHEGLKPYINLGFMPKKLAQKEEYVFNSNTNVSYPKSIKKWKDLVKNLVIHLIDKYGVEEVSTWYFEIWNNPDLQNIYWYETQEEFIKFFKETFKSIKEVNKSLKVGGSGCASNSLEWLEVFLNSIKELKIDFFSFNNYGIRIDKKLEKESIKEISFENYDEVTNTIKNIASLVKKTYLKKPEIIISEWNLNPNPKDFSNDTCYASSYIVKNVLNNFDLVDELVYWTFTENKIGTEIFYGGLGLFTTNNLKKASYNSFLLLNKLGSQIISTGTSHFITKKLDSYQILISNYENYNDSKEKKEIKINLKNIEKGNYLINKYYLNENSGSIYNYWIKMGAPQKITEDIFQLLKSKEKMEMEVFEENFISGNFVIKEIIPPNGMVFCEMKRKI
ncbi:MAG: helix-turn-helix domain-containing protein [Fusobacteriaceae bacterium]|nr:helix-turn-helix domain-containing protein [Fusobacteriaceae bacterium]